MKKLWNHYGRKWFVAYLCTYIGLGCAITSASISTEIPLNFGTYNPLSPTDLETVGRMAINCSGGTIAYSIVLSPGNNGTFSSRKLSNSHSYLNYNLYTDSAKTLIWGDGTQGTSIITGGGNCYNANEFQHIVYGRIPALQKNLLVGTYNDLVIMTLIY